MSNINFKEELRLLTLEASYHKKTLTVFAAALLTVAGAISFNTVPMAEESSAVEANTSFQVNVQDTLSVSVTSPVSGATGNVGEFLRNTVDLEVSSNVSGGFTASMYSANNTTDLVHKNLGDTYKIETISASTQKSSFPAGGWGYSLGAASYDGKTYGETSEGNNNSYYYPLTTSTSTPIKILSAASGTKSGSQNIYFGAKAANTTASGTYSGTVVISVVTGTVDAENPITPTNPATPGTDTNATDTNATYTGVGTTTGVGTSSSPANGTTVYTRRTTTPADETTTTTTEISAGNNTGSYANPQGVMANSNQGTLSSESPVPIALAATAAASAATGLIFFLLAKKRDEDDDEEQQQQ